MYPIAFPSPHEEIVIITEISISLSETKIHTCWPWLVLVFRISAERESSGYIAWVDLKTLNMRDRVMWVKLVQYHVSVSCFLRRQRISNHDIVE